MKKLAIIIICFVFGFNIDAQTLNFTQYNFANANSITINRTDEYVNDIGAFMVHEVVDNLLAANRFDIENWITANFTNVNTNAFTLVSNHRIVTTGENNITIAGNTQIVKFSFNIVEVGGSFYFNLTGKVGNLTGLNTTDMAAIETEINAIYASFINLVQ